MNKLPAHFYMAPSSASRWIPCPGSLRACADIPDEAGEAAERGTLGHHLVEIDLKGEPLEEPERSQLEAFSAAEREELEDAVDLCVEIVSDFDADVKLYETKIQSDLLEEHGGTIDVITYNKARKWLHVIDFKFGRIKVDPEDNKQLKCYVNLARQLFPEAERFWGSIIQPSVSDQIKTAEYTAKELDDHMADVLRASISDDLKAGDHCTFCPALAQCKVAAAHLRAEVESFPDLTATVAEVQNTPTEEQVEALCKIYKTFKLAEKATEGAGNILKRWASEGANVEAHGLGLRVTHRVAWKDNAEEVLTEIIGDVESLKESKLLTPKQAREALGMTKAKFEKECERALETKEVRSLVMGRGEKEFPEFD